MARGRIDHKLEDPGCWSIFSLIPTIRVYLLLINFLFNFMIRKILSGRVLRTIFRCWIILKWRLPVTSFPLSQPEGRDVCVLTVAHTPCFSQRWRRGRRFLLLLVFVVMRRRWWCKKIWLLSFFYSWSWLVGVATSGKDACLFWSPFPLQQTAGSRCSLHQGKEKGEGGWGWGSLSPIHMIPPLSCTAFLLCVYALWMPPGYGKVK